MSSSTNFCTNDSPVSPARICMLKAADSDGSDVVDVPADALCQPCAPTEDDTDLLGEFDSAQCPKGLTNVKAPTAEEEARHSLTHLPYRRWCKWCVMARMPNTPHHWLPPFSRSVPLLVMDYCFIRCLTDTENLTVLVAKLYPYSVIFACPCDEKGPDSYVTARFASWVRQCGITQCTYMCDQESALRTMMTATVDQLKVTAEWVGAIPENSAVGESQSNGKAERAIREVEGMVRCFKAELEHRVKVRFPVRHPVMQWLVEYMGVLLSKYHLLKDNTTPYQSLHGQRAQEKIAYFGESVFFFVPKRRRAKLDLCWAEGVYLGTLMGSNECLVGLPNGDVTRASGVSRVRADQRWKPRLLQDLTGTPGRPHSKDDDSILESFNNPHLHLDAEEIALLENEHELSDGLPPQLGNDRQLPSLRITRADLDRYGHHGDASDAPISNWGTTAPLTITATHADAECTMQCGAARTPKS